jgi:hypothetical protein
VSYINPVQPLTCDSVSITTQPTHEALESRHLDETGTHLVVKRFKRQFTKPFTANTMQEDPSSDFDLLPYFKWAEDSAAYVGKKLIQKLREKLQDQAGKLRQKFIVTGTSVKDITDRYHRMMNGLIDIGQFDKETKEDNSKEYDLGLSIAVYHLLRQEFGEATEDNHEKARQQWYDGAKAVLEVIEFAYLDGEDENTDKLADLKAKYPKLPKHLPDLMTVFLRHECVQARSFLAFLLSFKDLFGLNEAAQKGIAKMIVDCDALHKKEIPPSFVEFPGQKGESVMPGTFPEDVVEEVAAENFVIEPLYALRFPDPQPDADAPTPYAPRPTRTSKKPKGIVRRARQYFPENPRTPMPGDMPRRPRLKFDTKIVSTKPIGTLRERYGVRKAPSATTRKLWSSWMCHLLENAFEKPRLLGNIQLLMKRIPTGRPDDQTMEQAGGWGTEVDPVTGESVSRRPHTKLDVFLDETSREILQQPTEGTAHDTPKEVPVTKPAPMPEVDEAPEEPPTLISAWMRSELASMGVDRIRSRAEARPSRILQLRNPKVKPEKPVKTAEENQRELDLMLHDLEINEKGEVVRRPSLFPEGDLVISAKKRSDLELARQIRKEALEAAERKRVEEARRLAEEKRLREEEERRKRDEDRRRREEAERREKELEPAREAARRLAQLGLRQPMKPIISSLPAEWQTRVNAARDANPSVHLVTTGDGTPLTKRDFAEKLLPDQAWLNDNIVNGSFLHVRDWVNQRAAQTENPPCAAMSTYFWPHLRDKGAAQCSRMAKRVGVRPDNFEKLKTILIPICKGAHWTLAVVFPQLKAVTHMDSFRRGHGEAYVHTAILSWVKVMLGDKYKEDEWVALNIDAPQQTNGYDCGVFAITNSLCIALGLDPKLSYSERQLATQRKHLAAVLLNGGFKGDFDLTDL